MKTIILIPRMAVSVLSQDPVKTSPKLYKVLLDNDQVRMLEFPAQLLPVSRTSAGSDSWIAAKISIHKKEKQ